MCLFTLRKPAESASSVLVHSALGVDMGGVICIMSYSTVLYKKKSGQDLGTGGAIQKIGYSRKHGKRVGRLR